MIRPDKRMSPRVLSPVSLFNEYKSIVIGMHNWQEANLIYNEISFEGKVVGYLGTIKNHEIYDKQDAMFQKSFQNMLLQVGVLMIVFALLITLPISNYFTSLIQSITKATKKMAAGDYTTRVQSDRKDELGLLASNFNLLAKSLESNSEAQKTMIADIAHELRTPISVIFGEIEAMQDGIHPLNENNLGILHKQISSLKNLVNDLHDLSDSDLGSLKYKMRNFDLLELVSQCVTSHQLSFDKKNIQLNFKYNLSQCLFLGDTNRLNQLFNNLLSNSVQYTNNGGKTQLELTVKVNNIVFTIEDTEPNLDQDSINRIFNRWFRAEKSRNKNSGGSGLGLAICKEIIKAHDGKIYAELSSLGGIKITVKLPIKVVV